MERNHMIILIAAEGAFDKIQHSLLIKTLNKLEIEGNYLNIREATHEMSQQTKTSYSMVKD